MAAIQIRPQGQKLRLPKEGQDASAATCMDLEVWRRPRGAECAKYLCLWEHIHLLQAFMFKIC